MSDTGLRAKRGSIKGRLTTFKNYITEFQNIKEVTIINLNELKMRLKKIEKLFSEYDILQSKIEINEAEIESDERIEQAEREATEKIFYSVISISQELIATNDLRLSVSDKPVNNSQLSQSGMEASVKLPTIHIPTFDGNPSKWLEYHDTYCSLVHNNENISDICKYQYLKSSLTGSAASVIEALEISSANYNIAWNLVCDRFDNKKQLVYTHLKVLLNVPCIVRESDTSLRFLIDHISKHLRALSILKEPTDKWDTLIIFLFANKLDVSTGTKWEEFRNSLKKNPTLKDFFTFLKNRADILEMVTANASDKQDRQISPFKRLDKIQKAFVATTTSDANLPNSTSIKTCRVCSGDHAIYNCEQLSKMTVDDRNLTIKKLRMCTNCFRGGHFAHQCKSSPCSICRRKHHTLLHKSPSKPVEGGDIVSTPLALSSCIQTQVLLSTAIVYIKNGKNDTNVQVRCLLDCGSQSSFITENLKSKLGIQCESVDAVRVTGINDIAFNALSRCSIDIMPHSRSSTAAHKQVTAYVIPKITGQLPSEEFDTSNIKIPQNVILADPQYNCPSSIDLLLGADVFWDIIGSEKISLGKQMPTLQNSLFGWLIVGPLMVGQSNTIKNIHCGFTREIRDQLSKFWELEEVPATPVLSQQEEACEEHFVKYTRRLADGRFCVTLPLSNASQQLGDSFPMAKKRFNSLEKRFKRQPDVKNQYVDFIKEYKELGHLSEVEKPRNANFLPHHPVLKEHSESTKCRVVFDASAKTGSGYSLNDILMVGPTVQDDIFSILIRFREHAFILTGDIEKMYRQIYVEPHQRHLQMILWRDNEDERIRYLQLNTVTYGTSCAPFLSTRCLVQLGRECNDPLMREVIVRDFYVDDLLTGLNDEQELVYLSQRVIAYLSSAHFNLRKLKSNSRLLINSVSHSTSEKQENLIFSSNCNTLGVEWNPNNDTILMSCPKVLIEKTEMKYTKRMLLSVASSIFDPLGLLSICVILFKIILQSLWEQKLDWDDPIPHDTRIVWEKLVNSFHHIQSLTIPRHASCNNVVKIELHAFADASLKAYAGVIYMRSFDTVGNCIIRLLCAKSKVAPLKATTIPRLELCGALLVSRLCDKVSHALRCKIARKCFWSDSKIVLGWLRLPPNKLCTFVSHRVAEINERCSNVKWMHVPSAQNPADLASRGVYPDEVRSLSLWWEGPSFLRESEGHWPNQHGSLQKDLPEIRAHTVSFDKAKTPVIDMTRYSSFLKLRRIFGYVCRFVNNCKQKAHSNRNSGTLTVEELELAELRLAYVAQKESFPDLDINNTKLNPSLSSLSPFTDNFGLIRVGGRLKNSNFNYDKKYPIILDTKHNFTKLLFNYYHLKLMHAGPQLLLSVVREHYWPVNGRLLARRTYNDCTRCKRMKGIVAQQIMGNLPHQRVDPGFVFDVTGTDFAGPFYICNKIGRGACLVKCYLCIFIDFKVKAVHLEIVSSLSTEAFILALRRFISRRGKPREIFCDNGRNFVGASNALGDFLNNPENSSSVSDAFVNDGIKFCFSPAFAPNFGGLYESAVKSAKFHMKRVLGDRHLTFEELTTLFAQIEAILNSRPLCPLSSSPDDLSPLTPGHFLIGRPLTSLPAPDLQSVNPSRLHRFAKIEQARQHFWTRWSQEYICELQQRTKWQKRHPNIKPGQLVLIKDEATSPLKWPLGRIEVVHPGADGVCRVAEIRTTKGSIRRAINRICPFLDPTTEA